MNEYILEQAEQRLNPDDFNLTDCIDSEVRAKVFVDFNKGFNLDYIRSWFAMAIMNGYDAGYQKGRNETHELYKSEKVETPKLTHTDP